MRLFEFKDLGYQEHHELNPLLWDQGDLRPEIRSALLKIADEFVEFIDLDDLPVVDIYITGGQVSYHYTEHSDLDLHLVIDYDRVRCDQEVGELLDTKRLLFKKTRSIKIQGIPVEPGAEDLRDPTVSAAWSLTKNTWLREPENHSGSIDLKSVLRGSIYWAKLIDKILGQNSLELAKKTLKTLRNYRKQGLKRSGEYGVENLVYKTLRNQGQIRHLETWITDQEDRGLSLTPARSAAR